MGSKLTPLDYLAVALYFAAVLAAGLFSMCRANRGTVSGYFLAGRYMIWLPVGASLFASNIGSEHFIGLAGSGAAAGLAVGSFELNACILLQLLGWLFLPVYIASGVCTLPEFMSKRFGGTRIRMYLATLSLLLYILTKISVNLYSGALFIQQALEWNLYISVFLLLAATAVTTVTGGLAAVIYTDTLQAFVMVIGALTLAVISFMKVGGFQELYYKYMHAIPNSTLHSNTTCGYPREDSWVMLRDPRESDMPWPGFLFGQTPASIWYWCADQMMVQRALAARSLSHAQGGTLFAGYLKLLPVFLMVLPGMISRVLFPDEVACADPDICYEVCQSRVSCSNIAYPKLVLELLPAGLRGVMLSVMLAALMSDLTSIFNSASTLFTMDVYRHIRKSHTVRELMIVGRVFVCIMVVIGIIWIPVVQGMQGGQLYIYIQVISAYLAPPIAAVYLEAVLWKRANETGAFTALMTGFIVGMVRMILDFTHPEPNCGEEDTRHAILQIHYMYFAMFLFWLTGLIMLFVSLFTKPPTPDQLIRTTYWTRHDHAEEIEDELNINGDLPTFEVSSSADSDAKGVKLASDSDHVAMAYNKEKGEIEEVLLNEEKRRNSLTVEEKTIESKSLLRRGYDWFCGFNDSEEALLKQEEQTKHLKKICSLKQDPRAKIGLTVILLILLVLATFLYVLFSSGNFLGMLHMPEDSPPYNTTELLAGPTPWVPYTPS